MTSAFGVEHVSKTVGPGIAKAVVPSQGYGPMKAWAKHVGTLAGKAPKGSKRQGQLIRIGREAKAQAKGELRRP